MTKAGIAVWGASGDGNATTALSEPTRIAPQIGALGAAPARLSLAFLCAAGIDAELPTTRERAAVARLPRPDRRRHGPQHTPRARRRRPGRTHEVTLDGEPVSAPPVERPGVLGALPARLRRRPLRGGESPRGSATPRQGGGAWIRLVLAASRTIYEPGRQPSRLERPRDVKTLACVAAERRDAVDGRLGLEAFGDDGAAEVVAELDRRAKDRHVTFVRIDPRRERAVDLDLADRQIAQPAERRIAGAEIVERERDPQRVKSAQHRGGTRGVGRSALRACVWRAAPLRRFKALLDYFFCQRRNQSMNFGSPSLNRMVGL